MRTWYDNLEPEVRNLVRLLRDNGFNTICSCGHDMTVEFDFYKASDLDALLTLLVERGYAGFRVETSLHVPPEGFWHCRGKLYLKEWR